ncbi:MAG: DUF1456 family protein [Aurantibacter sp.]
MTNNDVLKKLRVALRFRDDDILQILELVDFKLSKSELGAFFRNENHPNYRECGDQILRNFLNGLVLHLRGTKENPKDPGEVLLGTIAQNKSEKSSKSYKSKSKKQADISYVKYKNKKKS